MRRCCTENSIVVIKTEGIFQTRLAYQSLSGTKLSEKDLAKLRESEISRLDSLKRKPDLESHELNSPPIPSVSQRIKNSVNVVFLILSTAGTIYLINDGSYWWAALTGMVAFFSNLSVVCTSTESVSSTTSIVFSILFTAGTIYLISNGSYWWAALTGFLAFMHFVSYGVAKADGHDPHASASSQQATRSSEKPQTTIYLPQNYRNPRQKEGVPWWGSSMNIEVYQIDGTKDSRPWLDRAMPILVDPGVHTFKVHFSLQMGQVYQDVNGTMDVVAEVSPDKKYCFYIEHDNPWGGREIHVRVVLREVE
jgi:hypothetical protein